MPDPHTRVCPATISWGLDNNFRKILQPPERIFGTFIHPGDTVLDIGCGPGFFTRAMARMVGDDGLVIAVDLQEEMLEKLQERAGREGLLRRIRVVKASEESLNLRGQNPAHFALAFYVVHEVPEKARFFRETYDALLPSGKLLVVEPKMHVTREEFHASARLAQNAGFRVFGERKVLLSRAMLLERMNRQGRSSRVAGSP